MLLITVFLSLYYLTQQIADEEIARKRDIIKSLDYLCQKIGDLNINLPKDLDYHYAINNRAMDVRSASMLFLSSRIKHDDNFFGTLGILELKFV